MPAIEPEVEGITIVLIGSFNPVIFHPVWLAKEGLIRQEESDEKVEVIHQDVSVLTADWFRLEVTRERFHVSTTHAHSYEPLRDLVIGIFNVLHHTPVQKMGLNLNRHFRMPSVKSWHALGDKLAPKEAWTVLERPGMRALTMEGVRPDGHKGHIWVRVEPSVRLEYGVYVQVNDHFELQISDGSTGAEPIMKILHDEWPAFMERSNKISKAVMELI